MCLEIRGLLKDDRFNSFLQGKKHGTLFAHCPVVFQWMSGHKIQGTNRRHTEAASETKLPDILTIHFFHFHMDFFAETGVWYVTNPRNAFIKNRNNEAKTPGKVVHCNAGWLLLDTSQRCSRTAAQATGTEIKNNKSMTSFLHVLTVGLLILAFISWRKH